MCPASLRGNILSLWFQRNRCVPVLFNDFTDTQGAMKEEVFAINTVQLQDGEYVLTATPANGGLARRLTFYVLD